MKKEAAIKYLKSHIDGQYNKIANIILKDIYNSATSNKLTPPFKILKISQLEEDIENFVDEELESIENESVPEDQKENNDLNENNPYFSESGSAIYNIQTGEIILNNSDTDFDEIFLNPNPNQEIILKDNITLDGMNVNGQISLFDKENNTTGIEIPEKYDGILIFNPLSKTNNQKINENIYGYFSLWF